MGALESRTCPVSYLGDGVTGNAFAKYLQAEGLPLTTCPSARPFINKVFLPNVLPFFPFFFFFLKFCFVLTRYGLLYNYLVKFPWLCVIQLVYISLALVGGMSVNHWESFVSVLYSIWFCPACIGLFMITATEIALRFPDKLGCRRQKASSPMLKPSRRLLTDQLLLRGAEAAVGHECRRCCSQPVGLYLFTGLLH